MTHGNDEPKVVAATAWQSLSAQPADNKYLNHSSRQTTWLTNVQAKAKKDLE